jgi:hypothetical protein
VTGGRDRVRKRTVDGVTDIERALEPPGSDRRRPSCRSLRPREDGRSDERLRAGARIVRIDRERESGRALRRLAIDLTEVFDDIAALGDPFAEFVGARAQDDISHCGGLLALADRASRCRRIPNVADDARPHCLRRAQPGDVNLCGLVVDLLLAGIAAGGKRNDLPSPLEDWHLIEIDRSFEVATDRRIVTLAPEVQDLLTVVRNDLEIVGGLSPLLLLPAARDAPRTDRIGAPVLDDDAIGRPGGGKHSAGDG